MSAHFEKGYFRLKEENQRLQAEVEKLTKDCFELSARCCIAPEGEGLVSGSWGPACIRQLKLNAVEEWIEQAERERSELPHSPEYMQAVREVAGILKETPKYAFVDKEDKDA